MICPECGEPVAGGGDCGCDVAIYSPPPVDALERRAAAGDPSALPLPFTEEEWAKIERSADADYPF